MSFKTKNDFIIKNGVLTGYTGDNRVRKLIIPQGVTRIDDKVFVAFSFLRKVVFPSTLRFIGKFAFANCVGIKHLEFPNNLVAIEEGAFHRCLGLTSVTLGASTIYLGKEAFAECVRLLNFWFPEECERTFIERDAFKKANNVRLFVTSPYTVPARFADKYGLKWVVWPAVAEEIKRHNHIIFP